MDVRVIITSWCGIGARAALYILLYVMPHPFAALLALADPLPQAIPPVLQAQPASEGAADALMGHLYAAADGSKRNIICKERRCPNAPAEASPGSAEEHGGDPPQSEEGPGAARAGSEAPPGLATNMSPGRRTGEKIYRAAPAGISQGLPQRATTAGRHAQSREGAEEPWSPAAPALSSEAKKLPDHVNRAPLHAGTAANMIRAGPLLGRKASASASLMHPYSTSPPVNAAATSDSLTPPVASGKAASLSPLAAAAVKRATPAGITPPPALAPPSGRVSPPFLSSARSASVATSGPAALEQPAKAAASRGGPGERRASTLTLSSRSIERPLRPELHGSFSRGPTGEIDLAGASATRATVSERGVATVSPATARIPSSHSSAAPSSTFSLAAATDYTSAVAAALLTGTMRRLAFDRCDRYTQKVKIAASPGDTIVVECPNAAHTVPPDITRYCCKGSCARCTTQSAIRYDTLYHMGSIPNFRYASGDGINTPWKLKVPESLQRPYPTFSVAWMGPAVLGIPVEAAAGASGLPVTTLVIHIEDRGQPEDKLALLRSPGGESECPTEDSTKEEKEEDTPWDENDDAFYGMLFERTPYGLRRMSYAPSAARPYCLLQFLAGFGGGVMKSFLLLMEPVCYVPWGAILSASLTGSVFR